MGFVDIVIIVALVLIALKLLKAVGKMAFYIVLGCAILWTVRGMLGLDLLSLFLGFLAGISV